MKYIVKQDFYIGEKNEPKKNEILEFVKKEKIQSDDEFIAHEFKRADGTRLVLCDFEVARFLEVIL